MSRTRFPWTIAAASSCVIAAIALGDEPLPTVSEIVTTIQAQRDLLKDNLLVEVEMSLIAGPSGTVEFARDRVALSGTAFAVAATLCHDPSGSGPCTKESALWDGVTGAAYYQIGNCAYLYDDASEATSRADSAIEMNEWFTSLRWYPVTMGGALKGADLLSALQSGGVSVRPVREVISGCACVVVDQHRPNGTVYETFWLDGDRGFVPILQRQFAPDGVLIVERNVIDLLCLSNGAWVPLAGTKYVPAREDTATSSEPIESSFQVTLNAGGVPVVSSSPTAAEFNLTDHIPAGARVFNADGTIAIADSSGGTTPMTLGAPETRLARAVESARSTLLNSRATNTTLWTWGVAAAALAAGLGFARLENRFKRRRT